MFQKNLDQSTYFLFQMDSIKQKIIRTAVASRVFIWTLSVISDNLVPNHDAGVFLWTSTPKAQPVTYCDKFFSLITDGLTNWDGQYFLHIANNGYTYENTLAFFPGYPFLVRIAGEILHWLQVEYGFISLITALKLSAILVNIALFTCAALALYDLSWRIFRDEYLAYKSVLFFCINPASIFFSATYSGKHNGCPNLKSNKKRKKLWKQCWSPFNLTNFCDKKNCFQNPITRPQPFSWWPSWTVDLVSKLVSC